MGIQFQLGGEGEGGGEGTKIYFHTKLIKIYCMLKPAFEDFNELF